MPAELNRLLNLVVLIAAAIVLPIALLLVPEVRAEPALRAALAGVAVVSVGPFAWSVVRARRAYRRHAAETLLDERRREHPLKAHLRTAEPDRHGVLTLDVSSHPDLDADVIDEMVVTSGWEVVSGEDQLLYLCRARPRLVHDEISAPVPPPAPPGLPRGVRARYNGSALLLIAGLSTLVCLGVFPDVRVGVAIGVTSTIAGTVLFQWAGVSRRRREDLDR